MPLIPFIVSLLSAIAFGQSLLSALILGPRARAGSIYLPLGLFFLINAAIELTVLTALPVFNNASPSRSALISFAAIPLYCSLAPLFWVYVRGLTSEHTKIWVAKDAWHFTLFIISLILPALAWLIPSDELLALLRPSSAYNPRTAIQTIIIAGVKAVDVLLILQITVYIILIVRRLSDYRKKLTQLFASTEHLELRWFRWLALLMLTYLLISIISMLVDALGSPSTVLTIWEAIVDVWLITTLAIWGLRQKPGLSIESEAVQADNQTVQKYQKSALSTKQCKILTVKIERAMTDDKLYRQDNLSLRILAKHISELPRYVTQTLNTDIGESFFDYINRWRIEEAMQRLRNSDETVLDIAINVGFNSRSSFYNAFKKITAITPTAYRKKPDLAA